MRAGDVLVGGFNFGTGSSREQAVTALQAKGIPLVIAGSFSQTYLRNAFNNGFPCIECPELVTQLRELFARRDRVRRRRRSCPATRSRSTSRPARSTYRGATFRFPPLGVVPQSLVVAGGVENQVRRQLGLG